VLGREKAALMRSVNEGIAFFAADSEPGEPGVLDRWSFLCECGARGCTDWVELELAAYAGIRAQPDAAVLAGGHALAWDDAAEPETVGMNSV
jgi:hypothetical protein